jgi:HD domain
VSTNDSPQHWENRRWAALSVRVLTFVAPAVVGLAVTSVLAAIIFLRSWSTAPKIAWLVALAIVGAVTGHFAAQQSRRLLPLAALLKLTLAFPDVAPSRMKMALRLGTAEQRKDAIRRFCDEGLQADPQQAAEAVVCLVADLHTHDRRTRGHSERVRAWADVIAQELKLSDADRNGLRWGAMLHDIGKLAVPAEILNKPGRPTEDEWKILATHPAEGAKRIQPLALFLGEWVGAIGEHHERWDGTGYPNGLAGKDISLSARIVAVADSFEVMTAARSYKKPQDMTAARAELVRCSGTHFDPQIVRAVLNASQDSSAGWVMGLISSIKALAEPLGTVAATVATVVGSVSVGLASQPATAAPTKPPATTRKVVPKKAPVATSTVASTVAASTPPQILALETTPPTEPPLTTDPTTTAVTSTTDAPTTTRPPAPATDTPSATSHVVSVSQATAPVPTPAPARQISNPPAIAQEEVAPSEPETLPPTTPPDSFAPTSPVPVTSVPVPVPVTSVTTSSTTKVTSTTKPSTTTTASTTTTSTTTTSTTTTSTTTTTPTTSSTTTTTTTTTTTPTSTTTSTQTTTLPPTTVRNCKGNGNGNGNGNGCRGTTTIP